MQNQKTSDNTTTLTFTDYLLAYFLPYDLSSGKREFCYDLLEVYWKRYCVPWVVVGVVFHVGGELLTAMNLVPLNMVFYALAFLGCFVAGCCLGAGLLSD